MIPFEQLLPGEVYYAEFEYQRTEENGLTMKIKNVTRSIIFRFNEMMGDIYGYTMPYYFSAIIADKDGSNSITKYDSYFTKIGTANLRFASKQEVKTLKLAEQEYFEHKDNKNIFK